MKLSEMAIEDIKPGMKVRSLATGNAGEVLEVLPRDREDYRVVIRWDSGIEDITWHFWLSKVVKED